jgi:hypothetical protein
MNSFILPFPDIDECKAPGLNNCSRDAICTNRLEGYDCECKPGMKGDGRNGHCAEIFPLAAKVIVGKHWFNTPIYGVSII